MDMQKDKRKNLQWLWPLFAALLFLGGCGSDINPLAYEEVKLPPLTEEQKALYEKESTYVDKVYKNQKGIMAIRKDNLYPKIRPLPSDEDYYMPLSPLNMPEEYRVEGLEIIFSGERINCDVWDVNSLPIVLTRLWVKKNNQINKEP